MHLHQQSVLAREVVQPLQQLSGDGIDGVRGDGHLYALAIVLFHQFENLLGVLLGLFRQLRIEVVDVRIPQEDPETHLRYRIRYPPHIEIHVCKGRGATFYHFQARQFGAPIDIRPRQFGFVRPDTFLQPFHQGHVVAETPKERHRSMAVHVHKAWDDGFSTRVDGPGGFHLQICAYARDKLPVDK